MEEERSYPVDCVCGKESLGTEYAYTKHIESKVHETAMLNMGYVKDENGELVELPEDLKYIIRLKDKNPMAIGKMLRFAFSDRGWPNRQHTGTVLDFMNDHNLPVFNVPRGNGNQAETDQFRRNQVKEYINNG
jgi:hypothetical protein